MKKLKKAVPEKTKRIIFGAVISAIGLFILLYPGSSLITLCTVSGIGMLILSVTRFIKYFSKKKNNSESPFDMVIAVMAFILAFILLIHPKFLLSVFPFIMGAAIVSYGISSFLSGRNRGIFSKIFSVVVVFFGGYLMLNPFKGATTITSIVGFGLLLWGIVTIVIQVISNKTPQLPDDIDGDGYREVDFKDV